MDYFTIEGGVALKGSIKVNGAKNATLPMLAACLLTKEKVILRNVPNVADVYTMCSLLESLGATVKHDKKAKTLEIQASNINNYLAHYDIVSKMRASIWVLAPLLSQYKEAKVSLPGGCAIGARKVDLHICVLKDMSADISIDHGYILAKTQQLVAIDFDFPIVSVGATITAILAATLSQGITRLNNCATEPEIQDLCKMLNQMGAKISNIGSNYLVIEGVTELSGVDYIIMPDRIEAGSYIIACAITKGTIELTNATDLPSMHNIIYKLAKTGLNITHKDNIISVDASNSKLLATDLQTMVYPGFPTDLQPQFTSLMTLANGTSCITENIFDNRFMAVPELCRMGADIQINNNSVVVKGVDTLCGANVTSSDLRGSMSLVIAALAAQDETIVKRIYHIDRGYENLEQNLTSLGAKIIRRKS